MVYTWLSVVRTALHSSSASLGYRKSLACDKRAAHQHFVFTAPTPHELLKAPVWACKGDLSCRACSTIRFSIIRMTGFFVSGKLETATMPAEGRTAVQPACFRCRGISTTTWLSRSPSSERRMRRVDWPGHHTGPAKAMTNEKGLR